MRWHREEPDAAEATSVGIALPRTARAVETVTRVLRHAVPGPRLAPLMAALASAGPDWRALADAVRDAGLSLAAFDDALTAQAGTPQPPPAGLRVLVARLLRRVHSEEACAWLERSGGPETGARRLARAVVMLSEYLTPWAPQDT